MIGLLQEVSVSKTNEYRPNTVLTPKDRSIRRLLEDPLPWPTGLDPNVGYSRVHDDHDGTWEGNISVSFHPEVADVWVDVFNQSGGPIRFRDEFGGGRSLRVRNALVLLALAIKLDNEERPDQLPQPPTD